MYAPTVVQNTLPCELAYRICSFEDINADAKTGQALPTMTAEAQEAEVEAAVAAATSRAQAAATARADATVLEVEAATHASTGVLQPGEYLPVLFTARGPTAQADADAVHVSSSVVGCFAPLPCPR